MLTLVTGLLLTWAAMAVARGTPIGHGLHRLLVAVPADRLARITRGHVVLATLVFGGTALIVAVLGHEAARVIAMGLPELATWATMFEITAYLDAAVAIVAAATTARWAGIRAWVASLPLPRRARPRAPGRPRRTRASRKSANDDVPGVALAA